MFRVSGFRVLVEDPKVPGSIVRKRLKLPPFAGLTALTLVPPWPKSSRTAFPGWLRIYGPKPETLNSAVAELPCNAGLVLAK